MAQQLKIRLESDSQHSVIVPRPRVINNRWNRIATMKYRSLLILIVCHVCSPLELQAQLARAIDCVTIDGTKFPFGTTIEIEGEITDSHQWYFGAASLNAQRIDGRPIQHQLEFHLHSNEKQKEASYEKLSALKHGSFYKVRGTLMNARFNGTRNICALVVEHFQPAPTISLKCNDFINQVASFDGIAAPSGKFIHEGELVSVEGLSAWSESTGGKRIQVRGTVRRDQGGLRIERPDWKLFQLKDLVNQEVTLEGMLWSLNGHWWFEYRDERVYLVSPAGPVKTFKSDDHGRPVRVKGRVSRQLRPSLHQISVKSDRDLIECFVIRGSAVEYLDPTATWSERFAPVYPTFNRIQDNLPMLLAEPCLRRNDFGHDTHARLYIDRNLEAIETTLHDFSPKTLDILAERMNDARTNQTLRLVYAAMLASANDQRGQNFLLKMSIPLGNTLDLDAVYCLCHFPFLQPRSERHKIKLEWAEATMIDLLKNKKLLKTVNAVGYTADRQRSVSDATVHYTDIATVVAWIGSVAGTQALLDYTLAGGSESSEVIGILCSMRKPLPIDDLLKLESVTKDSRTRRKILAGILRINTPRGVDRFFPDLESNFVYMDLRRHLSTELIQQLQPLVGRSKGDTKTHLHMLKVLAQKDSIPELLSLLSDQKWTDKSLVLFELARLSDARAVPVIARTLRESPKDFFGVHEDSQLRSVGAIENGLKAIANTGTSEAIQELVGLLKVDLGRFGTYIDRAGFQRIVASHLIELTGESFGVDAEAWQRWQQANPTYAVKRELLPSDETFRTDVNQVIDLGQ